MPNLRFRKHAPKQGYHTLRLKNYVTSTLPASQTFHDAAGNILIEEMNSDAATLTITSTGIKIIHNKLK